MKLLVFHSRIQCATSLAIFTTTLPQPLLTLSCTLTLRGRFMSTKTLRPCHRLTTRTPRIGPSKADVRTSCHQKSPELLRRW
ncbi:hypothetical protein EI94DRAFT_1746856 [Lactarius quietus]|nr:hypothetical protein EI94DRAFT_1746856 [Lactarius quietus]